MAAPVPYVRADLDDPAAAQALLDQWVEHPAEGCWPWRGCTDHKYGRIGVYIHGKRVMMRSHRLAFLLNRGYLPEPPLFVLHRCHNRLCCNPAHLKEGTHDENMQDMVEAGRAATGERHGWHTHPESLARGDRNGARRHPDRMPRGDGHYARQSPEKLARGAEHGCAKLTEPQAREIIALLAQGVRPHVIAPRYGVSRRAVASIACGHSWRHLPRPPHMRQPKPLRRAQAAL